jgi:hypothetical protein
MSVLAAQIVVSGPRPLPRPWATALTTYAELVGPEWEPDANGVKRWLNGVKFMPFGCEKVVGAVFDPCVLRTSAVLDGIGDPVSFNPFVIEMSVKCSALSVTDVDLTEYVLAHTEVARSSVCGAQVMQGAYAVTNPSLESESRVITGGDGSPRDALALIEDALADLLDGGAGMIHATPGVFSRLQLEGGLMFVNGDWYTASGHTVVADAGYLGPSPMTHTVVASESWIYGSGPVFYKLDDFVNIIGAPWENFNFRHDDVIIHAEQYGLAIFEPCSVVAAKVESDVPAGGDFSLFGGGP